MIAARTKGVLHHLGTRQLVDNGCYVCEFTLPKGRNLGLIGRDMLTRPGFGDAKYKSTL